MPLARITWQGLTSISVLVVCLWGCFVAETLTVRHARSETYRALRRVNQLRVERQIEPASAPVLKPRSILPAVS
jgi:hypothetical protein